MAFIASVAILATFLQNTGGPLAADPSRDRMLHVPIQDFFDGLLTVEQLYSAMDAYARQFEATPYKVGRSAIDLSKVPENRLQEWEQMLLRLIGPTLRAFKDGKVTPAQAAVRIAPFVLVFGGPYGFEPPGPNQSEELRRHISEFAAP